MVRDVARKAPFYLNGQVVKNVRELIFSDMPYIYSLKLPSGNWPIATSKTLKQKFTVQDAGYTTTNSMKIEIWSDGTTHYKLY